MCEGIMYHRYQYLLVIFLSAAMLRYVDSDASRLHYV
jgi:hypothetical protein